MLVVSVLARKGGTGKSTAVRCLAVEALKAGRRVVVIDADPQPTCHRWGQRRAASGIAVPLIVVPGPSGLTAQVEGFRTQGVDLILVDTPPTATPAVNAALDASTAAIIVTRPNPEDLESVQESLRVAGAQRRRCGVILWQAPPDKRVKAVTLAREALEAMGAAVCPTAVSASIAYPYAYAEGLTPQERDPEGRARAELADVWAWLQRECIVATGSYDKMAIKLHGRSASMVDGHPAALPDGPGALVPFDQSAISSQGQVAKLPAGHHTAVSDGSDAKRPTGAVIKRRSARP
jgi:chromosome partitioning protein